MKTKLNDYCSGQVTAVGFDNLKSSERKAFIRKVRFKNLQAKKGQMPPPLLS